MNKIYWFTGLSGSGKSTLAKKLEKWIDNCIILDGDILRKGLCSDLGFSDEDRKENIRRIAWITKLFYDAGMNVITAFISPFTKDRDFVRELIGEDFIEIYLSTSLEECERRDVKGLYKKAREGIITKFTGIDSPYETPQKPEFIFDTEKLSEEEIINTIVAETRTNLKSNYDPFDSDKKTSLMIGRWQPLHEGHKTLIKKVMDEKRNVIVGIRNMPQDSSNPFSVEDRIKMIKEAFGEKVRYIVLPEGTGGFEVVYGREVGWEMREVRLDKNLEKISGTKTREKMGINKKKGVNYDKGNKT